jgi:tRNA A37 threonylcarbamoyladenosine biosynthesis protein TsaE
MILRKEEQFFYMGIWELVGGRNNASCQQHSNILIIPCAMYAGKTAFSRGFLRAATGIPDLRVTSPTYLLSNTYQASTSPPIQ